MTLSIFNGKVYINGQQVTNESKEIFGEKITISGGKLV